MPNRLINEDSPYLQQHAQNPVEWYPWGEEAFEKARKEDKAIFLSIGYSSCHWCHVMEHESFENEEIAEKLNKNFISIKVDREERPDIDKHFQEIFVTMNGRAGGWPLSVFITPEKIPFYSATYIPPQEKYGMMGFAELLDVISRKYATDRKTLIEKGNEVLEFLKPKNKIEATKIDERLVEIVGKQIKQVYEKNYGGFGSAPKFPHASTLKLAIDLYRLGGDEELKNILTHTLDSMTLGGLYDLVDGGFCRYSTDEKWLVPHFEKMTYDNALMAEVLVYAWHATGMERYKKLAFETLDFMIKRMMEDNLFYSASDADTEGEEGKYFVYEFDEVISAFDSAGLPEAQTLAERIGIVPEGNFEGRSIVRLSSANDHDDPRVQKALKILADLRKEREYPFIDKKVQSSWNAMMIRALFVAGRVEERYTEQAVRTLEALDKKMAEGVTLKHSALIDREPKLESFLEDYAWWGTALMEGYQSTLDEHYLIRSVQLANEAIRRFYVDGRWRISDGEFKEFADDTDSSYPSSVSTMVDFLESVRSLVDTVYEKFVYRTLEVHSYNIMRQPISRPALAEAAIRYIKDDLIVKAKEEKLKPLVSRKDKFSYPWLYLRTTFENDYMLCNNSSCFSSEPTIEGLQKAVEYFSSNQL